MDRPPYQVAVRLYGIAVERWGDIDASYIHVDLLRLPAHRFCNAVWAWCHERVDPDKREEWEMLMTAPLPGEENKVTQMQAEDEGAEFLNFMNTMKGG